MALAGRIWVDGSTVVEASSELGGNVVKTTEAAAKGALEAAGTIGHPAVRTISETLSGVIEGTETLAHTVSTETPAQEPTESKVPNRTQGPEKRVADEHGSTPFGLFDARSR